MAWLLDIPAIYEDLFPIPSIPSKMFWFLSLTLFATPLFIFVSTLVKHRIRNYRSPLRKLPGPPSQSWLYGNLKEIFEKGQSVAWDEWMSTYGKTFRYPDIFNVHSLSRYSSLSFSSCFLDSFTLYHRPSSDKLYPHTLG